LEAALASCEALLRQERNGVDEALTAAKEAAVDRLAELMSGPQALDGADAALVERLRSVMVANRFSLRSNGLRAQLARLSQPPAKPKAPAQPAPPRIDLVS
jgi:hypothetical protein